MTIQPTPAKKETLEIPIVDDCMLGRGLDQALRRYLRIPRKRMGGADHLFRQAGQSNLGRLRTTGQYYKNWGKAAAA
jgi:hypothetical protein